MSLSKLLGYSLARALEVLEAEGQPAPAIAYTLAPSRRDDETREGLSPRVIGVKENTLIVSFFRDCPPRAKGENEHGT